MNGSETAMGKGNREFGAICKAPFQFLERYDSFCAKPKLDRSDLRLSQKERVASAVYAYL